MASEVSISNLALARLGQDQILSLLDQSASARACNAFYEQTRDEVLQSHPWRFAITTLKLTATTTKPAIQWDTEYQIPADCLRVISLNDIAPEAQEGYFEIQGDKIWTSEIEAIIRYVKRETDPTKFHPLFIEALACKLASRIAKPLTGSDGMAQGLMTEYERITGPRARRTDAFLGWKRPKPPYVNSHLVQSRFGAGAIWDF